jgi:hypothetical protein
LAIFFKFSPLKSLGQMNRNLVGSIYGRSSIKNLVGNIYGRSSIKSAHFVPIR